MTAADTTAQAQQAPTEAAGQELDARVARAMHPDWEVLDGDAPDYGRCLFRGHLPNPHIVVLGSTKQVCLYVGGSHTPAFSPSTDMNDAMRAAEAVGLWEKHRFGHHEGRPTVFCRGYILAIEVWTPLCDADTAALAVTLAVDAVASQRAQEGQGEK